MFLVRSTITRPADTTTYASGDLVANSTTAGSVTPFAFTQDGYAQPVKISRFIMRSSNDITANKNFHLFLFGGASPVVTNGDNGAFAVTAANGMNNFGGVFGSTAALITGGGAVQYFYPMDSAATFVNGWLEQHFTLPFYGLLRAQAAYVPASAETFTITAECTPIKYA
jgi:hypothetical protein